MTEPMTVRRTHDEQSPERDPNYVPPRTSTPSRVVRAARASPKKVASSVVTASQSDEERTLTGIPSGSATHKEGAYGSLGVSWLEEDSEFAEVDISLSAIQRYLYGEDIDANRTPLTAEFDYWWQIVKVGQFLIEPSLRETTKRWMALHLSVDGERADWVTARKGSIKKANRNFTTKFLWLIFRHYLSCTAADNIFTWDRAILMAAMIIGFEVDFAWLLKAVLHEMAFKVTTIYPFPCMLFLLCRSAGMRPMSYLHVEALSRVPPLGDNLADTVAQARTAASTNTTPIESIPGSSTALSYSRSTPFPTLVPLTRVRKLEAQMATLLHHILPWIQRSIGEAKERLERIMVQHTEWKIAEATVESLCADINIILEARVPESEAPSAAPVEDTLMAALFAISEILPPPHREHPKRRRGREEDEARARKELEHALLVLLKRPLTECCAYEHPSYLPLRIMKRAIKEFAKYETTESMTARRDHDDPS
ncbi:hypothetical protein EJD97_014399 [Solanum chilense]|uniref:Putative plant transposon protein domain-containing protein n=1 Tax=Solanum chilense TaxID=4083 RepID=A0A6N2C997_SOLCI|nr:hypothetical protein EJD97_014399 [Solanum chilense]